MTARPATDIPGAPPGTLSSRPGTTPSRIVFRRFGAQLFEEVSIADLAELPPKDPSTCVWVDVTGLGDTRTIAALGKAYRLHDLSLEDALDPTHRGKVDYYDDYTFVVLPTLRMAGAVEHSRLCLAFGDGFLITMQEERDAAVEPVLERLRSARGRLRDRGADYLAYALLDSVIDHYFPVVEAFDDFLETVEDAMLEDDTSPIESAQTARKYLRTIRHAVWPTREIVTSLLREDASWVTEETRVHLRDCYDHIIKLQDMVEASREIATSLLEAYLTKVSLRTNEVMKVLTVISTIFIPLTFITGLYGMNFNRTNAPYNMPELDWYWGYPATLLVMLLTVLVSLRYIRRKGWTGNPTPTTQGHKRASSAQGLTHRPPRS